MSKIYVFMIANERSITKEYNVFYTLSAEMHELLELSDIYHKFFIGMISEV